MIQDIYIIDNTDSVRNVLKNIFKNEVDYQFKSVKTEELNIALKNIPDMIIIDEDTIDMDIVELCKNIRENEDNSITPIIVISSEWEKEHRVKVLSKSVEYFIIKQSSYRSSWKCSNSGRDEEKTIEQRKVCGVLFRFR